MNLERVKFLKEIIDTGRLEIDLEKGTLKTYKGIVKSKNNKGYVQTGLKCSDGKVRAFRVHEIIAVAGGLDITNLTVNHKDGVKDHNWLSNLEAGSTADNYRHARETGLIKNFASGKRASDSKQKKLTDEQINEMKIMFGQVRQTDIANYFGVSESLVSQIKSGLKKNWLK